ncbi:MAG TPA: type II toxin-antitoxin system death-on-curing family toxin [Verrucomicrobiae bacterium]|nr:type II toxin-antitoxin system death-on-curing family toxin [Verrucomicrobiae bacterium]
MREPLWLSKILVLALHERLVSEFGGLPGLRDEGLLESALGKPKNVFAYKNPTAFDLAASYAFGLVKNHPFFDGNKRIGFAAAAVFLETNGFRFNATEVETTTATLALAAGDLSEEDFSAWLRQGSEKARALSQGKWSNAGPKRRMKKK